MKEITKVSGPEIPEQKPMVVDRENTTPEQAEVAFEMLRAAKDLDSRTTLDLMSKAITKIGGIAGGFESSDIDFDHNPSTGRTILTIKPTAQPDTVAGGAGLPDPTTYPLHTGAYVSKVIKVSNVWYLADDAGKSTGVVATIIKFGSVADGVAKAWTVDYLRFVEDTIA